MIMCGDLLPFFERKENVSINHIITQPLVVVWDFIGLISQGRTEGKIVFCNTAVRQGTHTPHG